MTIYNCPFDCNFQLPAGGFWDNPYIAGCAIGDKFAENTTFELDTQYPTCPFYMRPLLVLSGSKEAV